MYGAIARVLLKPGVSIEAFSELQTQVQTMDMPGLVAAYVFQMNQNKDEYQVAVVFESEDAFRASLNQMARQLAQYTRFATYLDAFPRWNEGHIVFNR